MNAIALCDIETDTSVARQLRECEEFAALGVALGRAVARKALEQLEANVPAQQAAKTPNYLQIFLRLGTLVRQIHALETSLVTGEKPRSRARKAAQPADLRRNLLRQAIDFAVGEGEERAASRRAARENLDLHLAADPHGEKRAAALLHAVLDPLGISISFGKMPSALRDALTGKTSWPPPHK